MSKMPNKISRLTGCLCHTVCILCLISVAQPQKPYCTAWPGKEILLPPSALGSSSSAVGSIDSLLASPGCRIWNWIQLKGCWLSWAGENCIKIGFPWVFQENWFSLREMDFPKTYWESVSPEKPTFVQLPPGLFRKECTVLLGYCDNIYCDRWQMGYCGNFVSKLLIQKLNLPLWNHRIIYGNRLLWQFSHSLTESQYPGSTAL